MNGAEDCSEQMKDTATQVIVFSALALLGSIMVAINGSRPMGEMGPFIYVFSRVLVCFAIWGLATGIGLWRKWPWARISMLVFCGILVTPGIVFLVVMLLPLGDPGQWTWSAMSLKILLEAINLIPLAVGVRLWKYFTRQCVKSYFSV